MNSLSIQSYSFFYAMINLYTSLILENNNENNKNCWYVSFSDNHYGYFSNNRAIIWYIDTILWNRNDFIEYHLYFTYISRRKMDNYSCI